VEFYDSVKLRKDALLRTSIRVNQSKVYRKSSNGDNFAFFADMWGNMTKAQKTPHLRNQGTFQSLLGQIFGSEGNDLDKWLPVIKRDLLTAELAKFCETPWGRSVFVLGNVHAAISCHFDFVCLLSLLIFFFFFSLVSFPSFASLPPSSFFLGLMVADYSPLQIFTQRLAEFNGWFKSIFGTNATLVSAESVDAILRLPMPRQPQTARHLFFPTAEDFILAEDKHHLNTIGINMEEVKRSFDEGDDPDWPRLAQAYELDDVEYLFRRPNFLEKFTSEEYTATFHRLTRMPGMEMVFPDWTEFQNDCRKAGPLTKHLLVHLIMWFTPTWKMPKTSSAELPSFQFTSAIESNVISRRLPGYSNPADPDVTQTNAAKQLILDIFTNAAQNFEEWTYSSTSSMVSIPSQLQHGGVKQLTHNRQEGYDVSSGSVRV
jgi:hypothetical protein